MKKIIDKIKANKKLCKGLKIFKLVLDCLTYGFAIFMIIGLAIGSAYTPKESQAQQRELIPNVATTPIKRSYQGQGYVVYSCVGDLGTDNFLIGLFEQYQKYNPEIEYDNYGTLTDWAYVSNNSTWTYYFSSNQGSISPLGYLISWGAINLGNLSSYNNENYLISGFKFLKTNYADYTRTDGQRMRAVYLDITPVIAGGTEPYKLSIIIDFFYDGSNNIKFSGVAGISSQGGDFFVVVNDNINNEILFNMIYNSVSNKVGYDQGFKVGYDQGVADSQTQQNGVFGLLKQAFQSVASVLNIQLIPGLNLGILIFAPLIVTIIIVIIKMFRG